MPQAHISNSHGWHLSGRAHLAQTKELAAASVSLWGWAASCMLMWEKYLSDHLHPEPTSPPALYNRLRGRAQTYMATSRSCVDSASCPKELPLGCSGNSGGPVCSAVSTAWIYGCRPTLPGPLSPPWAAPKSHVPH